MWVEDEDEVGQIATNYFKSLFNSDGPDERAIQKVTGCVTSKIPDHLQRELEQPCTPEVRLRQP